MEKYLGEPGVCLMCMFLEPLGCGSRTNRMDKRGYLRVPKTVAEATTRIHYSTMFSRKGYLQTSLKASQGWIPSILWGLVSVHTHITTLNDCRGLVKF